MEQEHQEHQNAVEQESRAKVALQEQENITKLHIRVTSLCHFSNITLTWHVQRCLEMQGNGQGAMEDSST